MVVASTTKAKRGRPRLKNKRVIMTITMSFDPVSDSAILTVLHNAPKGKRAELALGMMRNGAPAISSAPSVTITVADVELILNDSEFQ